MSSSEPEIAIVVEGGVISAIATNRKGITCRIIDLDNIKVDPEASWVDVEPDATCIDIEEYSRDIIRDVKGE